MKTLYEKNQLTFALVWIVVYCVLQSLANPLNKAIGVEYAASAGFCILQALALFAFIRKNGLLKRYGLCKSPVPARRFLCYLPLVVLASGNLWNGAALHYAPAETVCRIVCMLCVGFLGPAVRGHCKGQCEVRRHHFQRDLRHRAYHQPVQRQRYGPGQQSVPDRVCHCGGLPAGHDLLSRRQSDPLHPRPLGHQYPGHVCQ